MKYGREEIQLQSYLALRYEILLSGQLYYPASLL